MFNIVVLSSSGGGNFEIAIENQKTIGYTISKLIVDRECGAIKRAKENNIEYTIIERKNRDRMTQCLLESIPINTDLIILLGWLSFLSAEFIEKCNVKIINIHPSLLPKYGGKGMYGVYVHEAVMKNKETYTGCTVHYVTSQIDQGKIILQKKLKIDYSKTPWELGGEVFKLENKALIEAIKIMMKTGKSKEKGDERMNNVVELRKSLHCYGYFDEKGN